LSFAVSLLRVMNIFIFLYQFMIIVVISSEASVLSLIFKMVESNPQEVEVMQQVLEAINYQNSLLIQISLQQGKPCTLCQQ
jgi:hypothetical protein